MAVARITHNWDDGTSTELAVSLDESYPDALDECRVQVLRMYDAVCASEADASDD